MKVCFTHNDFDAEVSSGTIHALYQWFELFHGFGVKECAIINISGDILPHIDSSIVVHEYESLDQFLKNHSGNEIFVDQGGAEYRGYDYSDTEWLIFGSTASLPQADVGINTGGVALYPREAAAIILSEATHGRHVVRGNSKQL